MTSAVTLLALQSTIGRPAFLVLGACPLRAIKRFIYADVMVLVHMYMLP